MILAQDLTDDGPVRIDYIFQAAFVPTKTPETWRRLLGRGSEIRIVVGANFAHVVEVFLKIAVVVSIGQNIITDRIRILLLPLAHFAWK